jgi:NADPH-dependent ferric siderophore reductase
VVIDFALHDNGGPASNWAAAAEPGSVAVLTPGKGAYRIDPAADWTLLVADETSLPAVGTILDDAPDGTRVILIIEVEDEHERIDFGSTRERLDVTETWFYRNGQDLLGGTLAAQAAVDLPLPAGQGSFWVGLESSAMRTVRRHLINDRHVAREAVYTRAYWKSGTAHNRDGDLGEEI